MHAEIISVGDEITSGQLLDTNSQWLSLRLEELGIRVLHHVTVGDELEPMVAAFAQALGRSDVIVTTGGLGPTADDLTRDALARATGRELVLVADALEHIRRLFARRRREMPPSNEVQAMFPEGSRVIPNPDGTAPGIDIEGPRPSAAPARLFALPGVPAEMRQMWDLTLAPELRKMGAGRSVIRHRRIKCFGAGESQMESMLPDLVRRGREPRVGINASQATIIFRVTSTGTTDEQARAAAEPVVATIRECLGPLVFGEEDDELQDAVLRLLQTQGKTLATAEWGTAGLITQWLGAADAARGVYLGGVVVGSQRALESVLGLPDAAARQGARHGEELVTAMAAACRTRFGSDVSLAVGPFPEPDIAAAESPRLHFGLATSGGVTARAVPFAAHPALLTVLCAKQALDTVRRALIEA